jgi:methyl-accepting chemotaxis protein PixJ
LGGIGLKFFDVEASPLWRWVKRTAAEFESAEFESAEFESVESKPFEQPKSFQNQEAPPVHPPHPPTATNPAMKLEHPGTRSNSKLANPGSLQNVPQPDGSNPQLVNRQPSSALEWMLSTVNRMRQAESVDRLFAVTVVQIQQYFQADRVLLYQFQSESQGTVAAESVVEGYTPSLGESLPAIAFGAAKSSDYQQQPFVALHDRSQTSLSPHQQQLLDRFQVRASLSLPIVVRNQQKSLLVIQQCSRSRQWQESDIVLLHPIITELRLRLQPLAFDHEQEVLSRLQDKLRQPFEPTAGTTELKSVLQTVLQTVRKYLNVDRVVIAQVNSQMNSQTQASIIYEAGENPSMLGECWQVAELSNPQADRSLQPLLISDLATANFSHPYQNLWEQFEIQAGAIIPILQGQTQWGFLAAFHHRGTWQWNRDEIRFLSQVSQSLGTALQQREYQEQLRTSAEQFTQTSERSKLVSKIVDRIRQSLDLQKTFKTTAKEIRNFLQVDRVAIFKFDPESNYTTGQTIAEDVQPGYVSAMKVRVEDHCFNENYAELYRKGRVWAVADIYHAGLQTCYIDVLAQFQVRANLVVPLLRGEELWGLFCIHHCSEAREWQEVEIEFAQQIAAQLNVAIQQGEYVEQLQQQSQQLAEAALREKADKDALQQRVIQLLLAVRPALEGNLTVRAPVTDDEVGTIADAYNNTLSSLQQIVIQMQAASNQMAQTSEGSKAAITSLAVQAQTQLQSLNQALEQVQQMVESTQSVETSVQQVELAVQQANQTVIAGDAAMDRTVDEMQEIRDIVTETNQRLQRLSDSSQKISKVVSLISHFTTQTQLLALNAAIEATRAGEYGRGFAVVADEVRSLARQSADAAVEIEQLVQDIQASTAEVATAMETSIQQVTSGTRVASEARENLNSIVDATSQISQVVSNITQSMQQQIQQCQSMTQTMQNVATIATHTSADSQSIAISFKDLLNLAQDLKAKSQQFTVT